MRLPDATTVDRIATYVGRAALAMVDHANHKPENKGGRPKVGGHQASSMSSLHLLTALYLGARRPEDLVAVKPHAAPVLYALMHLLGQLPTARMGRLRELGGPQPYPTRPKDPRIVDYTTSSEALGVCATVYDACAAVLQERQLTRTAGAPSIAPTFWAHCGDGELTEGQIDESLYDAGRWGLSNLVWIVDLNRQSLDRVMDDSGRLEDWAAAKFAGHGWAVRRLRWGRHAEALFARDGGEALRAVLERLPDAWFHPLLLLDGAAVRAALTGGEEHPDPARAALLRAFAAAVPTTEAERRGAARALAGVDDDALRRGLHHLGGHDVDVLMRAYAEARAHADGPIVLLAHTVKGWGTSHAAHPENHGMLLPTEEVLAWGEGLPEGPWPVPPAGSPEAAVLAEHRARCFDAVDHGWAPPPLDLAEALADVRLARRDVASTGEAFQSLNLALLRTAAAPWLQFGAPDVGQTTHLGPVIKKTGVFAPRDLPDTLGFLRADKAVSFDWRPSADGQFHSLGIAEGNAMLWAYAFGRQVKVVEGRHPLLPVVTVYDKFFERGLNQLDYAAYSHARFVAVGVPSGTGLSRETATHQSLSTPRMVMDMPGIVAWEPAFGEDLRVIYLDALRRCWAPDGEATYLRLTTQPIPQPTELPPDHAAQVRSGAYWLVGEDDRTAPDLPTVLFVAAGRKVDCARRAAAILRAEHGVGSRILVVTSYEVLWRDWDAFRSDPEAWRTPGRSYRLHDLFADAEINAPLVLVGDHVPSVCEWLPGALQRLRSARVLGPRRNGEAGDLASVDALHGMGVDDLVRVALEELRWR